MKKDLICGAIIITACAALWFLVPDRPRQGQLELTDVELVHTERRLIVERTDTFRDKATGQTYQRSRIEEGHASPCVRQ